MKHNKIMLFLIGVMLVMSFAPMGNAQTNSLAVWENIADGTLTSTWVEVADGEWAGQNDSGVWEYNCTTSDFAWTYNATTNGDRWMNTWEVTANDAEAGVASIMVHNLTVFYGVVYYLDFNGTGPEAYIIYYDGADFYYWNDADTFDTNVSNATDLSHDCEWDYFNGWCRVKAEWNFNDATWLAVRFKIWEPSGDEPIDWMVDEQISPCDYSGTSYKSGLFADGRYDLDPTEVDFRRIFFWNLSYDEYAPILPLVNLEIACPTITAEDLYVDYVDYMDTDDVWNQTQLMKTYINLWDLATIYTEDFWGDASNQNDTVYHFSIMITDTRDFFTQMFGPGIPDEFPDNMLLMRTFLAPDGSDNESDYMLLRIDTDNNDIYDSYDYAIWSNDTDMILYQGWTPFVDPWFGDMYSGPVTTGEFGEGFRDQSYYMYETFISWDKIYNGATGERVGTDICRMSINWYDNDTDSFLAIADFDPTDDTNPYPATDGRIASDDPTFLGYNDSMNWVYFWVDTSISGTPLADPEDPVSLLTGVPHEFATNYIPIIMAGALLFTVIAIALTGDLTVDKLVALLVIAIIAIVTISIIMGV